VCNPMLLAVAGGAIGAVGSIYQGVQQSQSYNEQAGFADRAAISEGQSGYYEARKLREATDRQIGDIRQQYVSGGIALEGGADAVVADTATSAMLDEKAILYDAQNRADNKRFEAKLARSNAQSAMIGGLLGGASSLIGGISGGIKNSSTITTLSNPYAVA
jgi:hypothetical protein